MNIKIEIYRFKMNIYIHSFDGEYDQSLRFSGFFSPVILVPTNFNFMRCKYFFL